VAVLLETAIDGNKTSLVRALDQSGRAEPAPAVGALALPSPLEDLAEQAVVVIDAVAVARESERREGIQEAGGQAAKAAVAERRVVLGFPHLFEVHAELFEGLAALLVDPEVVQIVCEGAADQELEGEVVDALGSGRFDPSLGLDHALDQEIPCGEGDRHEQIVAAEVLPTLA